MELGDKSQKLFELGLNEYVAWEIYRNPSKMMFVPDQLEGKSVLAIRMRRKKNILCTVSLEGSVSSSKKEILETVYLWVRKQFQDPESTTSRIFNERGDALERISYLNPKKIEGLVH